MRVLFTAWGWPSHLYALVPLAWACRSAGHDVLLAVPPTILDQAVHSGLPAAAVGTDTDAVDMVRGYVLPSVQSGPGGNAPRTGKGPRALRMFLAHAEAMAPDLVALAREWRPDAVVFEPTAWAGPVAAAAVGVPAIRHLYGVDLLARAAGMIPVLLEPLAAQAGAPGPVDPAAHLTIDPVPPSLRLSVPSSDPTPPVIPVRYIPYGGAAAPHAGVPPRDGRPRVCVTWGHTMGRLDPARCLAGPVAAAVAGADIDVVAVVSAAQAARQGPLPGVTVLVDAPLEWVVADTDLVVAHGGAATVLTALRYGVPLLLVPQLPDHAGHAAQVLAAVAGEVLTRDEATPDRLYAEVRRLLRDSHVRAGARTLRDEARAAPSPAELAVRLPELLQTGAALGEARNGSSCAV
ncbi:MAG: DUF1205 domain-containing protein [Pseudonocardia sp.]|nr:DUF1205 domain-containing protein [Pseudonocardia sp.]